MSEISITGERARPRIFYQPERLPELTDQVESALLSEGNVYSYAGTLATVCDAKATTVGELTGGDLGKVIQIYFMDALRERVMRAMDFYSLGRGRTQGNWNPIKCPDDILKTLLARRGGKAPPLAGLLPIPTVCSDGRDIYIPHYDYETGLLPTFGPGKFFTPPSHADGLTRQRAKESYQFLVKELFAEFSFRDPIDASVAVAALLTGVVRSTCGIAPAFAFTAPVQGTGKTTLASVIGEVITGYAPGANSWPASDEELEKVILSILRDGQKIILFDNVPKGERIRSAPLAKLLTGTVFQGRILGQSQTLSLPSSVLVLFTGNNITLEDDMASRVFECYLDAGMERPDRRHYSRDVCRWARAHRAEIVQAALTVILAFVSPEAPQDDRRTKVANRTPTRFPEWDRLVRFPIVWAGGEDIAVKLDQAHDADPGLLPLRELLQSWRPALGESPVTASEVVAKVDQGGMATEVQEFERALKGLVGDGRFSPMTPNSIGTRLVRYLNRPLDGLMLVRKYDSHKKQNSWAVAEARERFAGSAGGLRVVENATTRTGKKPL